MTHLAPNLADALRACLPHVAKDGLVSVLGGVRLVSGVAYATDRYTLARAEYDCDHYDDHDIWVSAETVKAVLAAKNPVASIGLSDAANSATIRLQNGQTFTVPSTHTVGDYPNVERLIPAKNDVAEASAANVFGADLRHLEKFAAKHFARFNSAGRAGGVRGAHPVRMQLQADATKPIRVDVPASPWFVGVVVPMRLGDN